MLTHYVNLSIFSLITVEETGAVNNKPEVRDGGKVRPQSMTENKIKIAAGYEHLCSYGGNHDLSNL